jgi:hypothetical protein
MLMEMLMKVTGRMANLMDLESTTTLMERHMKDTGIKISNMGMGRKLGLTILALKENTNKAKRKAKASSYMQTGQPIEGCSKTTTLMGKVSTHGQTIVNSSSTMESGKIIRCMGKESLPG